jgi:hypothetical protein
LYNTRHLLDNDQIGIVGSYRSDFYEIKGYNELPSTGKGVVTHILSKKNNWTAVQKCKYHEAAGTGSSASGDC